MSEGLENCPFCGSKSEFWERSIEDGEYESLIVGCKECSANMEVWVPRFSENFERNVQVAKAKLISDWNHRVVTDTNVGCKFDKDIDVPAKERTVKVVEHDASITDTDGYKYHRSEYLCGACKKKVLSGDDYCSHCGVKLDWGE